MAATKPGGFRPVPYNLDIGAYVLVMQVDGPIERAQVTSNIVGQNECRSNKTFCTHQTLNPVYLLKRVLTIVK